MQYDYLPVTGVTNKESWKIFYSRNWVGFGNL